MTVERLHKKYFQKSRIFLYPMLDIRKGSKILPEQTYIAWQGFIKPEDRKLICLYELEDSNDFKSFEKAKLFGNKKFDNIMLTNDNKGLYIFTFDDIRSDYNLFLNGKYSYTSKEFKDKLESYYGKNSASYEFVMSYLYPEDYYDVYAKLLDVDVKLLKEVGELCAPFDLDKETLKLTEENLKIPDLII
jgi:hypothetical protein